MLSPKLQEALNSQINAEYYSSYLYLAMSAYCEEINLKGFGHWFRIQSQEEMIHVMKFFQYVIDRKGRVQLARSKPRRWTGARHRRFSRQCWSRAARDFADQWSGAGRGRRERLRHARTPGVVYHRAGGGGGEC